MTVILPEGELLRRAAAWVADTRRDKPAIPVSSLVEEACLRFDLSPKDSEILYDFFRVPSGSGDPGAPRCE